MVDDSSLEEILRWLLSFMSHKEWKSRKTEIESYIESALHKREERKFAEPISVYNDRVGWYIYLLEVYLENNTKYEPVQGARVLPIFQRFGIDIDVLKSIGGLNKKMKRLIKKEKSNADATFFEVTTALLWARTGWDVKFIDEAPPDKRPDLFAKRNNDEWYIECKRLSQHSEYSRLEKDKFAVMATKIGQLLLDHDIILDIKFHVELKELEDSFLLDQLGNKLELITLPGTIISNDIWEVHVSFVDYESIRRHLLQFYVKSPSPQLIELIGGRRDEHRGFYYGMTGKMHKPQDEPGNNIYVDKIAKAFGIFWSCDASKATESKARDIKRQVVAALNQLPANGKAAIHICIETLDGPEVEKHRYSKILNTIEEFDDSGKDLRWIYCHFIQSYAPPDQSWVIDESLYHFISSKAKNGSEIDDPLAHKFLIVPWDVGEDANLHWLKDTP